MREMNKSNTEQDRSAVVKPSVVTKWDLAVALASLLALLPMLAFRWAAMLSEPGLRFFLLLLPVLGVIVVLRGLPSRAAEHPVRVWTAIGLFVFGVLLAAYSIWIFSPWLAQFASVIVFLAWALGRFGQRDWPEVVGWSGVLATTLALPFGWTAGLTSWLQLTAAWCTSKALDAFQIANLRIGNSIELKDFQLFADQVCGGWASIYALAAITAVLLVVGHRSLLVAIKSILALPLWMVLIHFIQLLTICLVFEFYGRDLASGSDYLVLQIGTFLLGVFLSWLLMHTLSSLYEPVPVADAEFGPVFSGLNKALCWPQPDPFEALEPEDMHERKHFQKLKEQREAAKAKWSPVYWFDHPKAKWSVLVGAGVLVLAGLAPWTLIATGSLRPSFAAATLPVETVERIVAIALPTELEDWRLVVNADEPGPMIAKVRSGTTAISWQYQKAAQIYTLTAELPFRGWHDSTLQRERYGWAVGGKNIETGQSNWPVFTAELENDLGGRAYLFSSMVDQDLESFEGLPDDAEAEQTEKAGELRITDLLSGQERQEDTTTIQIELFCESGEPLSDDEQDALKAKFLELRDCFIGAAGVSAARVSESQETSANNGLNGTSQ